MLLQQISLQNRCWSGVSQFRWFFRDSICFGDKRSSLQAI